MKKNPLKQESKRLRITVTDTGYGISKENQTKLFGQYVQFNAAALQQGKGSGLGLWISKSKEAIYSIQYRLVLSLFISQ